MLDDLDSLSILTLWTAIAVYAGAFIVYAFDLAKRSSSATVAAKVAVTAGGGGSVATEAVDLAPADAADVPADGDAPAKPRFVLARVGTSLMVLAWLFHLVATVTRGFANGHVP